MTTAGLFAGGYGKRLYPLTVDRPKVLIEIETGICLMDIMLRNLKQAKISRIFLMTGHLSEMIEERYGAEWEGLRIEIINEGTPKGTLHAFRTLADLVEDDLLLMNGDIMTDLDLGGLIDTSRSSGNKMVMVVRKMVSPYGIVDIREGKVASFREKPTLPFMMNSGIYHFNDLPYDLLYGPYERNNIEETILSEMAKRGDIGAYEHSGFHASLDSFKDLDSIREYLRSNSHSYIK